MKRWQIVLIILIAVILIATAIVLIYSFKSDEPTSIPDTNEQELDCLELGCPSGSIYVGSINSDKYYVCNCSYAKRILPDNLNCFSSDEEAQEEGYTKIDC